MIGYFDYTVLLTYASAISASIGIFVSLSGTGHPYFGVLFLMISGLCDAFDGQVARTKKNRTLQGKNFGIQIDSLSDLIAFGVLPACIGAALYRCFSRALIRPGHALVLKIPYPVLVAVFALYILAALIRLAYYNVTKEERQGTEGGKRRWYTGLPVTSSALIFPTFLLMQECIGVDLSLGYYLLLLLTAATFLSKIRIPKPHMMAIMIMIAVGAVELGFLMAARHLFHG